MGFFQSQAVNSIKTDIIKSLSLYYYTFVDIMDFKVGFLLLKNVCCCLKVFPQENIFVNVVVGILLQDHVTDLLTTMDACGVYFDIVSSLIVYLLLSSSNEKRE